MVQNEAAERSSKDEAAEGGSKDEATEASSKGEAAEGSKDEATIDIATAKFASLLPKARFVPYNLSLIHI